MYLLVIGKYEKQLLYHMYLSAPSGHRNKWSVPSTETACCRNPS